MAYFADLQPYSYGHGKHPGVVHIGWLDAIHSFSTGDVASETRQKLKRMARKPVELYRGFHICEICRQRECRGNGEIRVCGKDVVFAAPVLIVHYIEEHKYLPPQVFLSALEQAPE